MKIYFTRHGQTNTNTFIHGDNRFPAEDIPLTELGAKQAQALGKHMKEMGFHGVIYSSPYRRTMETATYIAEACDLRVRVLVGIREIFRGDRPGHPFHGMTGEELEKEFPLADAKGIPYPWWSNHQEDQEEVTTRVRSALDDVLGDRTGPDVLFVGHGASTHSMRVCLGVKNNAEPHGPWNCGLSMLDTETGENYAFDVSFMPDELVTDNRKSRAQVLAERAEAKKTV